MPGLVIFLQKGSNSRNRLFTQAVESTNLLNHRGQRHLSVSQICNGIVVGKCVHGSDWQTQPLKLQNTHICFDGTLYNRQCLQQKYRMVCETDEELVLRLFLRFRSLQPFIDELDGMFVFAVFDANKTNIHLARDYLGLCPLYWTGSEGRTIGLASEAKALLLHPPFHGSCIQFPPGHCVTLNLSTSQHDNTPPKIQPFRLRNYVLGIHTLLRAKTLTPSDNSAPSFTHSGLRNLLQCAVNKRLPNTRTVGCFLAGLSSSLLASMLVKSWLSRSQPATDVYTYTIGVRGSPDLKHARETARYLGTTHKEIVLTPQEFLNAARKTIWHLESYDIRTVRKAIPYFLLGKYVEKEGRSHVYFTGDGAADVFATDPLFNNLVEKSSFQKEHVKFLVHNHFFGVLRLDRSTPGIDLRTPFLDTTFTKFVMSINPKQKRHGEAACTQNMDKHVLRTAFIGKQMLPNRTLWRRTLSIDQGLCPNDHTWKNVLQKEAHLTRLRFTGTASLHNRPPNWTDEEWWYKHLFHQQFGHNHQPFPWLSEHLSSGRESKSSNLSFKK